MTNNSDVQSKSLDELEKTSGGFIGDIIGGVVDTGAAVVDCVLDPTPAKIATTAVDTFAPKPAADVAKAVCGQVGGFGVAGEVTGVNEALDMQGELFKKGSFLNVVAKSK